MKIFQCIRKNYRYFIGMDSKLFPFYGKFDSFHRETIDIQYAHDYLTYSLERK